MKYILSQLQTERFKKFIQKFIDNELQYLKDESADWGMDMMSEILQVSSINRIFVEDIVFGEKMEVHVTIDFSKYTVCDEIIGFIDGSLSQQFFPNSEIIVDNY